MDSNSSREHNATFQRTRVVVHARKEAERYNGVRLLFLHVTEESDGFVDKLGFEAAFYDEPVDRARLHAGIGIVDAAPVDGDGAGEGVAFQAIHAEDGEVRTGLDDGGDATSFVQ